MTRKWFPGILQLLSFESPWQLIREFQKQGKLLQEILVLLQLTFPPLFYRHRDPTLPQSVCEIQSFSLLNNHYSKLFLVTSSGDLPMRMMMSLMLRTILALAQIKVTICNDFALFNDKQFGRSSMHTRRKDDCMVCSYITVCVCVNR